MIGVALLTPTIVYCADTYPVKPVRIVAPFAPGGGGDTVARLIAQKLSESLAQPIIVENRPGASNIIGTELVARAAPDGYTLLVMNTVHTINGAIIAKLPYHTLNDFTAITLIATTPFILIAHPSLPVKSVRELIMLARARPGQINYASAGQGTPGHLAVEMLRGATGIDIVHIPYKGITQALIDTVAGATQIMILSPVGTLAQVKAGRVRALAVTTAQRSNAESLRALPTLRESGVADYEFSSWYGMIGPRGIPAAIIARLNEAAHKGLAQNDLRGKLAAEAAEAAPGTPEQFTALLQQEVQRYTALARKFKLQAI